MDRGEKVAYYCSELGKSRTQTNSSETNHSSISANNNNNIVGNFDPDADNKQLQDSEQQHPRNGDGQPLGNEQTRVINRFNPSQMEQQMMADQHGRPQFVQNQIIGTPQSQQQHQQQAMQAASQPQYLISNSNPQHLTNLNPHHLNQQQHHSNTNAPFPNQIHSASYHVNSNHLYQAGSAQQQQQQQQHQIRAQQYQHHKSTSQGDDSHIKMQANNQVIFHENNKQQLQKHLSGSGVEIESQRRQNAAQQQLLQHQQQLANQGESSSSNSAGLTSSQSMTHNDFTGLRRIALTSEVGGLENLNLDHEAMLMNDGSNLMNNNNNIQQYPMKLNANSGQNLEKQFRLLNIQQNVADINATDKPNNGGSDMSSTGYGRPVIVGQQEPNRGSVFMADNRSDDNIYEEIDPKTIRQLEADYPIDSISLHSDTWKKKNGKKFLGASFTRWFSTRKKSSNSQNSDQEENPYVDSKSIKRPRIISLPETVPDNLTQDMQKRRFIVGSIVDSENSYTNSLYRLIYEYKKPLEEADPPILSANKIRIIFYRLEQILQFHTLFGFSLNYHVKEWDEKELIGSVFTTFSQPVVLEIYSGFINNFTNAMETARRASKSKAFAQFLHDKSVSSPDRLSFFGSMVKPVQRFPQFILLLSDLLKCTPYNHPDRMPLQKALTELESLADTLNERKRDAERHFAVKQLLKVHLNETNTHSQRFLLRQDDTCLLDMDPNTNAILKSKNRKIYLLNDMLICVNQPSNRLKFAVPLSDISVIESITPAISNLLMHSNFRNLNDNSNMPSSPQNYTIERMECERQSLVHDMEIMMRIAGLVAALRFQYNGLNPAAPEQICLGIREEIRKKEFQMTLIDRSCLQLKLNSKNNKDTLVVQFNSPESKRDWLIDVRLTKLALDRANNPGWENVTDNPPPTHQASLCSIGQRVPLFVKSLAIFKSDQSHLTCALHYYLRQAPFIGENPAGVLWICNVNVGASSLGALATNGAEVSLIHSYELSDSHVTCLESVGSTLWIGLRQGRIIVIDANSPSEWNQYASLDVQNEVTCIKHFGPFVYVGLIDGSVAVFDPLNNLDKPLKIQLSQSPVTCLLPINEQVFACSHNRIWRIKETKVVDSSVVQDATNLIHEEMSRPNLLAHCGSGLWVSLIDSSVVKLYHAETLEYLAEIDVGTSIRRVLNDFNDQLKITVTSLMATRGLLWIGTNVGMIATLTLPRLQGVPLFSGSINVALHRFLGPVNIMLNLSAGSECIPQLPFNNRNQQQIKPNHVMKNEDAEAIYGQYADLMNVGDYITSGRKSGGLGETPATSAWEFPNVNISGMNVSDDSGSSASSGAIYQDGVPRGMKQVQNKAVVANAANMVSMNQQQQMANAQNQLVATGSLGGQPANQINDLNIYDKAQSQSVTYNQGSLNGAIRPQTHSDAVSLDRLQQQQQQQRQMLSASQSQLAFPNKAAPEQQQQQQQLDPSNSTADYGPQTNKIPNKLYDQPAQLIQQQQIMQQTGQAANQMDGNILNNMQPSVSGYGTLGGGAGMSTGVPNGVGGKLKPFIGNKTVLVLAGGNGYQRMAIGDNKPFGEHAHCIIWEYKA